jgi:hypothetical protein
MRAVFSLYLVAELPVFPSAAVLLDPSSVNIPHARQTLSFEITSCFAYITVQHCFYHSLLNRIFPKAHVSCTEEAAQLQFLPSCYTKSGVCVYFN